VVFGLLYGDTSVAITLRGSTHNRDQAVEPL
jgi:hypothetical protein